MPSLKAIRLRIQSVRNTQKVTRAMKLMAAARLRRAQENLLAARPYARTLEDVIAEVVLRAVGPGGQGSERKQGEAVPADEELNPLLEVRPERRVAILPVTSDRGQAGAFNANINRAAERYLLENREKMEEIGYLPVGRKGRDYLRRRKLPVIRDIVGITSQSALEIARRLAPEVVDSYRAKKVDAVYLLYNAFKSAISQEVRTVRLLPVKPKPLPEGTVPLDYLYEPSKRAVLDRILPLYVEVQIYRALLESIAAEFAARMTAMDNATNNAEEIIDTLTLQYNRARQAYITKELLEIIGGAEALKG